MQFTEKLQILFFFFEKLQILIVKVHFLWKLRVIIKWYYHLNWRVLRTAEVIDLLLQWKFHLRQYYTLLRRIQEIKD